MDIIGIISAEENIYGTLSGESEIVGVISTPSIIKNSDYDGSYTITPGDQPVVLQTQGHNMESNVVVEAIPSNYGRISYNGSILTVW